MCQKLLYFLFIISIGAEGYSQDDPCTAIPLPLSPVGSCNYIIGDNTGATDSDLINPNIDAPSGCEPVSANYAGADVWFYIDLGPTTTSIEIDLTHIATSNFDDGVIALYTGTCGGNLSIVECDDDSGSGFLEPNFSVLNTLTPNTRVYVRVWEWGGSDEGTFNICASEVVPVPPPSCGDSFYDTGGPSGDYSNDELITTTLVPDVANTAIVATFTYFETEACCDELRVYDGPDATFPLIGTYAGNVIPPVLTSNHPSGALTFVFESDFSITGGGFAADITCVDRCNLIISDTNYPIGSDSCNLDYIELTTNAVPPPPTNVIFSETFDNATFPTGWSTVNGAASANWIISTTNNAGGTANEAMLDWITGSDNSTWTLSSPPINIAGQTNLQLSFYHDLWQFGTNFSIYLETSLDNIAWTTQYSVANPPDISEIRNVDLSSLDGNNTFYLRFRLTGDSFDIFYWAIDNVVVSADGTPSPPQIIWIPETGLYTDSTLTTPYTAGNFAGTVYAAPNGVQTYTATDENGCTDTVTVTFNKKIWNGTAGNTNWNTATNWLPIGIPGDNNCIIIPDTGGNDPIINGTTNGNGLNLTIQNGASLTQQPNSTLTIVNVIDVETGATYTMEDSASLIQIDDVANTVDGLFAMDRTANMRQNDYVYWSSPVTSFNIENVSSGTPNGYKYEWVPTLFQGIGPIGVGDMVFGEWQGYDTGAMVVGKGYIIRGPNGHPNAPSPFSVNFNGIPNNGEIIQPIVRGDYNGADYLYQPNVPGPFLTVTSDDDNWNLIGNPYPSAINAIDFLTLPANSNIDGFVYLWTHGTDINAGNPDPFYDDYVFNYNPADYVAYNASGTSIPTGFLGNIAAGQGFFVLMNDLATTTETVTFNNSMRNSSYANNQFYRTGEQESNSSNETHRIWLDYIPPNGTTNTTLIAYVSGATNSQDRLYDAKILQSSGLNLYSLIEENSFIIQGRQLPFDDSDIVPLGLNVTEAGSQTIAINGLEGLFLDDQNPIYIEDLYTGTLHDLKSAPYFFNSAEGVFNDRLILRYNAESLGLDDPNASQGLIVYQREDKINIESKSNSISDIKVYDVLGRSLLEKSNINLNRYTIEELSPKTQVLLLKISLIDGTEHFAKIIF